MYDVLDIAHEANPIELLIAGGAAGADSLAADWAAYRNVKAQIFRADWENEGRSAGPKRNQRMIDEGKPHMVIAFPGGRGTADMVPARGGGQGSRSQSHGVANFGGPCLLVSEECREPRNNQ